MPEYRVMDNAGTYLIQERVGKKTWENVGEASDIKTAKMLLRSFREGELNV